MVSKDIINFLGIHHNYINNNCITIIIRFYKEVLGLDISSIVPYKSIKSRKWMLDITLEDIDKAASTHGYEIPFQEIKNYDIMIFKDSKDNPIHFGMFLSPTKIFHLEEGRVSSIDYLSDYWMSRLYKVYRHEKL